MDDVIHIESRIRDIVLAGSGQPDLDRRLTADFPLIDSGVIDSLRLVELIARIESGFELLIEADEILPENFATIREIARFVAGKQGA
jgi:acyl carrier protein